MKTETITIGVESVERPDARPGDPFEYRVYSSVFGVTTRTRDTFGLETAERLACDIYDMLDSVGVPLQPKLDHDVHDPSGRKEHSDA